MPVQDGPWGCRMPRTTALLLVAMAALLVVELGRADEVASYLVVLVGSVLLTTIVLAWRLVRVDSFEDRIVTVALAGVTLVGQLLASALGGPGRAVGPHWDPVGLCVAALAVLALALVAPRRRPAPERSRHPYAL